MWFNAAENICFTQMLKHWQNALYRYSDHHNDKSALAGLTYFPILSNHIFGTLKPVLVHLRNIVY